MHRRVEYGHGGDGPSAVMIASALPESAGMSVYLVEGGPEDPWRPVLVHAESFFGDEQFVNQQMRHAQEFIPVTRDPVTFVVDWEGGFKHAERALRREAVLYELEILSVWPLHDELGIAAIRLIGVGERHGLIELRIDNHGPIVSGTIPVDGLTPSEQRVYRGWLNGKVELTT